MVCLHQNGASPSSIIEIISLVGFGKCARDLTKCVPWAPEDIFFLYIDTDGSRRSRVNEAQSAEEKEHFEDGPLEPGCKMCSLQKQKNSNMVSATAK